MMHMRSERLLAAISHSARVLPLLLAVAVAASGCGGGARPETAPDAGLTPPDSLDPGSGPSLQDAAILGEDIPLTPRPAVPEPALDDTVTVTPKLPAHVFQDVHFDFDKADIREDAVETLTRIADWLRGHGEVVVLVQGHTDERGTNEYNLALGERRALAVRRYLVSLGVAPRQMQTVSYGEERPIAYGSDEASWARNRRAHFEPVPGVPS
jgi:peptidoglycan-associated lipoprotein